MRFRSGRFRSIFGGGDEYPTTSGVERIPGNPVDRVDCNGAVSHTGLFRLERLLCDRSLRSISVVAPLGGQVASLLSAAISADQAVVFAALPDLFGGAFWIVGLILVVIAVCELTGLRYIANNKVGVVEKLWSFKGSVPEGRIIALDGDAGFQAEVLRGGMHFGLWRWQFR